MCFAEAIDKIFDKCLWEVLFASKAVFLKFYFFVFITFDKLFPNYPRYSEKLFSQTGVFFISQTETVNRYMFKPLVGNGQATTLGSSFAKIFQSVLLNH